LSRFRVEIKRRKRPKTGWGGKKGGATGGLAAPPKGGHVMDVTSGRKQDTGKKTGSVIRNLWDNPCQSVKEINKIDRRQKKTVTHRDGSKE
jgi:hypothetical protein